MPQTIQETIHQNRPPTISEAFREILIEFATIQKELFYGADGLSYPQSLRIYETTTNLHLPEFLRTALPSLLTAALTSKEKLEIMEQAYKAASAHEQFEEM